MPFDPEKFGRAMGEAINRAVAPLMSRVSELEVKLSSLASQPPAESLKMPEVPPPPTASEVAAQIVPEIQEQVKGTIQAFLEDAEVSFQAALKKAQEVSQEATTKALSELRTPQDGKSVTLDDVRPILDQALTDLTSRVEKSLENAIKAIPEPLAMTGAFIDRDGNLQFTLSNGTIKNLGPVVGRDGVDLTEVTFDFDGVRTFTIEGKGGSIKKTLPIPVDRGYWREGMVCEKNDIVTHDGNAWLALTDNKEKPSVADKVNWRLFVRKGRDGETVVKRPPAPPTPVKLRGPNAHSQ